MARAIRRLYDEKPDVKLWDTYMYLESEPAALALLADRYARKGEEARRLAYENAAPFIYYLKQAREYYRAARAAALMVKPLILYYGMLGLAKAYVLMLDPHYPAGTGVLRHGMSTRKRKKAAYRYRDDEVKVQKEGLLPHLLSLIGETGALQEKYRIRECLGHLPQFPDIFRHAAHEAMLAPVYVPRMEEEPVPGVTSLFVQESLLDHFHLRAAAFVRMLNRYNAAAAGGVFSLESEQRGRRYLKIVWRHPRIRHVTQSGSGFQNTMLLEGAAGQYFLRLTTERRLHVPEFILHFLLMFHLSMLARYETERWGEIVLTFGSEERYLIYELLKYTERHFPNLILNEMFNVQFIFMQP